MRTLSGPETTLLASAYYQVGFRVKVANGDGTMIDYTSYVASIKTDEEIDQPVSQAILEFIRSASATLSLVPLRTDSTLNVLDDTVTYSPAIDAGRLITIEVYTIAIGASPAGGDYKLLFKGYIDSVDAASPLIAVVCRDEGGLLVDRWIEVENTYAAGTALEDVIQGTLDGAFPPDPVPTLFVPASPGFGIGVVGPPAIDFTQSQMSVMDALQALSALIGWDTRYKWDNGDSEFKLTLSEPDRTKTTADYTFGPSRYINVSKMAIDRSGVRNVIAVKYIGMGTSPVTITVEDTDSITRYGRKWMEVVEAAESQIDTEAEATALANAILSDLKDPLAENTIERPFWWPAQLGDLYAFSTNSVHYNATQKFAVVGIRHELTPESHRTTLTTRGKPAGGYLTWLKRGISVPGIIKGCGDPNGVETGLPGVIYWDFCQGPIYINTDGGTSWSIVNGGYGLVQFDLDTPTPGTEIPIDAECRRIIPADIVITEWWALTDQDATIEAEMWVETYAGYPARTTAEKISASAPIATTAAQTGADTSLTGWTPTVPARSIMVLHVTANDVAESISVGCFYTFTS